MLPYMIKHDWLQGYAGMPGLQRVMEGMSRRSRFASGMEKAPAFLQEHYPAFNAEFEQFFPELRQCVATFLAETKGKVASDDADQPVTRHSSTDYFYHP